MHVLLSHVVLPLLDPFEIPRQKDANTLTVVLWFDYKSLGSLYIKLVFELLCVTWQYPSLGKEFIFRWHQFLHCVQVLG
jgi:hypothetical protein